MNAFTSPWEISESAFPAQASLAEQLEFIVGYALLAPSSHNTQPWIFRIRGNTIDIFADRSRTLAVSDPHDRELTMSCGAALFHLRLALRHFQLFGAVEILPEAKDPDLLARVHVGHEGNTSPEETLMFHAIPKRRTNRQRFKTDPLPPKLMAVLHTAVFHEGAWMHWVLDPEERTQIADLIGEADRVQWANRRFRMELAAWLHPHNHLCRDGIPGYAQDADDLISSLGPLVVRTFDMGQGQAAKNTDIALNSPGLAVFGTADDTPSDWLVMGQALAHVLLRARVEDVWASFLNQPIEVLELRHELTHIIGRSGHPQLILRFGFGDDVRPTPRRLVDEVLI